MALDTRIEAAIAAALRLGLGGDAPPRLSSALPCAVNPGGARIRPTILLSVALACGDNRPRLTDAAAAALKLIHCASLVHDDLPCFDDADVRRGKPTVHMACSEPLAVLTGDSLIVLAFDVLAQAGVDDPLRAPGLVRILAARTGMPGASVRGRAGNPRPRWIRAPVTGPRRGRCSSPRRRWAHRRQGRTPSPGPNLRRVSARRSRSPTTCAMRSMMPRLWANPPGRTWCMTVRLR